MALFQSLIFFIFGAGLLLVDYRGLSRGWLPCGPRGFLSRLEVRRDGQPFFYWLLFLLYAAGGAAAVIFALMLLTGHATPLPVR
jgi:hypothetical protein